MRAPGCEIDLAAGEVRWPDRDEALSSLEVAVLRHLADAEDPVPASTLLTEVWGYDPRARSRAVTVLISRLRRKVEVVPSRPSFLVTVDRRGYALQVAPGPQADLRRDAMGVVAALAGPSAAAAMAALDRDAWLALAAASEPATESALLMACADHAMRTDLGVQPTRLLDAAARCPEARAALVARAARLLVRRGAYRQAAEIVADHGLADPDAVAAATPDDLDLLLPQIGVLHGRGEHDRALAFSRAGLERAELLGDRSLRGAFCERVGAALARLRTDDPMPWFDESIATFRGVGDAFRLAAAHHNAGTHLVRTGHTERGCAHLQDAVAAADRAGDRHTRRSAELALAAAQLADAPHDAVASATAVLEATRGGDDRRSWAMAELLAGIGRWALGAHDDAEAHVRAAAHLMMRAGMHHQAGVALRWRGWFEHMRGDAEAAADSYACAQTRLRPGVERALCTTAAALLDDRRTTEGWSEVGLDPAWLDAPEQAPPAPWRRSLEATAALGRVSRTV